MAKEILTIRQTHELLKNKKISSVEITQEALEKIDRVDKKIKAFITVVPEVALEQARQADQLIKNEKEVCWLTGVPYGLKDIIVTQDIQTTAASKILEGFNPPYSATVYERLLSVKAVVVGKLNCDEFAMGASTENSAYQKTLNPHDHSKVPGGSSGGSAAAVAAGLVPYTLGTDTGGSIRQPASFCGVVGLKPTYGRVSRYGLIPLGNSLDQAGPIAHCVEDAALVLNIISGYDSKDSTSAKKPLPDYSKSLDKPIKGKKIGVPKEYLGQGIDSEVKKIFENSLAKLDKIGAEIVEISLPHTEQAVAVYYILMSSEVSTNLSRYDGVRFGKGREQFGSEPIRRIMLGTYSLSSGYFDAYYLKAAKVRRLIFEDFQNAFKKVDFIAGPVSPILPFSFGEKVENPLSMYLADILTVPQNLAGLPGISVPAGFADKLPVGIQFTANHWEEENLLNLAHQFETAVALPKGLEEKV